MLSLETGVDFNILFVEGQLLAIDVHGQVVPFQEIVELGKMDATLSTKPEM
jgi:hypothetical protein